MISVFYLFSRGKVEQNTGVEVEIRRNLWVTSLCEPHHYVTILTLNRCKFEYLPAGLKVTESVNPVVHVYRQNQVIIYQII